MGELGSLALAYGAGALSTLSPCVLPILPIILLGALERHAWGPVALAAGLSVSFAAVGVTVAAIGFNIGLESAAIRLAVAAALVLFGAALLIPSLQNRLAMLAAPLANGGQSLFGRIAPAGLGGQFALGALLGLVWSPCSGPTLGAAIGLAAQTDAVVKAALLMAVFGAGASTPILALAYGSRQALAARRQRLAAVSRLGKPIMGVSLVTVGVLVLSGLDKLIEASLTRAMPDWLVNLTTRL